MRNGHPKTLVSADLETSLRYIKDTAAVSMINKLVGEARTSDSDRDRECTNQGELHGLPSGELDLA